MCSFTSGSTDEITSKSKNNLCCQVYAVNMALMEEKHNITNIIMSVIIITTTTIIISVIIGIIIRFMLRTATL